MATHKTSSGGIQLYPQILVWGQFIRNPSRLTPVEIHYSYRRGSSYRRLQNVAHLLTDITVYGRSATIHLGGLTGPWRRLVQAVNLAETSSPTRENHLYRFRPSKEHTPTQLLHRYIITKLTQLRQGQAWPPFGAETPATLVRVP
ncbi:hypothetical protein BsWGS_01681 [Bradybaena similaris]